MRTHLRAADVATLLPARLALVDRPQAPGVSRLEQVLAPLCIVAVAAAFLAQVLVGDNVTLGAVAVVPVLAASMLRSRGLTLLVVGFAVLLQVWGVAQGVLDRDEAGMQIAVYLLTLALAALQQSRSPQAAIAEAQRQVAVVTPPQAVQVMHVDGAAAPEITALPLPETLAQRLTRRERDVVALAVYGCTAREIGRRLFIGERTVETHLANAYGKLGVRSKMELIRLVSALPLSSAEFRTGTEARQKVTA